MGSTRRPLGLAPPALESLDAAECRRYLDEVAVGRLAMRGADAPELRPVNFVRRGERLIVRTGEGSILDAARRGESASFEIDGIDPLEHTGWSVVASGKLSELPSDEENRALPLRAWASDRKDRFVALTLDRVSGLRIPAGRGNR